MDSNYKQIHQLTDSIFNIDSIDKYALSIELGKVCLRICIVDITSKRCLFFEDYVILRKDNEEEVLSIVKKIFSQHSFLDAQFWNKIHIILSSNNSTLIPKKYFNVNLLDGYLKSIGEINSNNKIDYDFIGEHEANNVYEVSSKIKDFFASKYGDKVVFMHKYTSLTKALYKHLKPIVGENDNHLNVIVDNKLLFIGVYKGLKLKTFNEIPVTSAEKLAKTVLYAFKFYGFKPKQDTIRIWGTLKEESNIVKFFKKYVDKVEKKYVENDIIIVEEVASFDISTYFDIYNTIHLEVLSA